jgi:antitoxin YefM
MVTVYRLHVNELNDQFIEAVQAFFKDKEVEITITEVDETEYLLRTQANRTRLMQAVSNIENGKNLVKVPTDTWQ